MSSKHPSNLLLADVRGKLDSFPPFLEMLERRSIKELTEIAMYTYLYLVSVCPGKSKYNRTFGRGAVR